eukprot:CAMPEP_0172427414 /NCGR_PEP_ID=MMETSP1064-20121228/41930_1 /TAXON_ID=202472 /ORGANISM="Aulacoseira subarctica , Strain CCAP 1002/5" /LENGTH=931 /DNA_ID=CAMNT_0013171599 /DNA_START=43 /DNA_END=2838 /DNA_ORIENTATION=-
MADEGGTVTNDVVDHPAIDEAAQKVASGVILSTEEEKEQGITYNKSLSPSSPILSSAASAPEDIVVSSPQQFVLKSKSSEDSYYGHKNSYEDEEEEDYTALYEQHEWLLVGIKDPHQNDVLYGRGGGTNHHPGNKRYRLLVDERKIEYVNSKRLEKPLVALDIIRKWRKEQVPPGRFLKVNEATGLWDDVGDKKAREKTSQALREKAPVLRRQCQEEEEEEDFYNQHQQEYSLRMPHPPPSSYDPRMYAPYQPGAFDADEEEDPRHHPFVERYSPNAEQPSRNVEVERTRYSPAPQQRTVTREPSIRFADGTKDAPSASKDVVRPNMSRFHSLGTEMPDEDALNGFSWESPAILSVDEDFFHSKEEDYYPPEYEGTLSHPEGINRREHNLATTGSRNPPLRHVARESAPSYNASYAPDYYDGGMGAQLVDPYSVHHPPARGVGSEDPIFYGATYHRGTTRGSPPIKQQQQQHPNATTKYSPPDVYESYPPPPPPHPSSRNRRAYPSSEVDPYYNSNNVGSEPYARYSNPKPSLEPIYYPDEVTTTEEPSHYSATEDYWPRNSTDYDTFPPQISSGRGGYTNTDPSQPYPSSTRTRKAGERIHIPASRPSSVPHPAYPPSMDYPPHPSSSIPDSRNKAGHHLDYNISNDDRMIPGASSHRSMEHNTEYDYDRAVYTASGRTYPPEYSHGRDYIDRIATSHSSSLDPYNTRLDHPENPNPATRKAIVTPRGGGGPVYAHPPPRHAPREEQQQYSPPQENLYYSPQNQQHDVIVQKNAYVAPSGSNASSTKRGVRSRGEPEDETKVNSNNYEANANVARPIMKRDTSHQNENPATKKETKLRRAVEEPVPITSLLEDSMHTLDQYIADIRIGDTNTGRIDKQASNNVAKPNPISNHSRMTTLDFITDSFLLEEDNLHNSGQIGSLDDIYKQNKN